MIQRSHQPSLGILNTQKPERNSSSCASPSEDLSHFIKHYWIIHWDLTGQEPHQQDVVPNPCANLVVQSRRTAFTAYRARGIPIIWRARGKYSASNSGPADSIRSRT